jgi:Adenosine deaminase
MIQNEIEPILLDDTACYAALKAHDARFDGRFFVGVASTGIYCRPICHAKLPKKDNCSFYASAAAAEAAGYRPCLKCRPELAPGLAPVDAISRIARQAAMIMDDDCLADRKISDLATMLGITDRHLRRAFAAEYGVSPTRYLQTQKLLLAKNLLTDTHISVTDIAMISGFGSIRRFNDLFKKHYSLSPSKLRKNENNTTQNQQEIQLFLGYRPPYRWDSLVSFLADRAIPGVESVADGVYRRTVSLKNGAEIYQGWFSITNVPDKNSLSVTIAPELFPVLTRVLAKIKTLFDTACNPAEVYERLTVMNDLARGTFVSGIRLPGCFDPFEMSVRAILGQQVTVKAARTLAMRLAENLGEKINTPFDELKYTFPSPEKIHGLAGPVEDHLGPLGITGARARSIYALANALITGQITLSHYADPEVEMKKLLELPGFGPWTVQYVGMRALGWPDAFPHTDYGVKKALPGLTPAGIVELSQSWRPWRSYATIALWNSLNNKAKQADSLI